MRQQELKTFVDQLAEAAVQVQVLYYFLGKMLVLQPDADHWFVQPNEAQHPMLPPGAGLYTLRRPGDPLCVFCLLALPVTALLVDDLCWGQPDVVRHPADTQQSAAILLVVVHMRLVLQLVLCPHTPQS